MHPETAAVDSARLAAATPATFEGTAGRITLVLLVRQPGNEVFL
jgi:hypothetical protein